MIKACKNCHVLTEESVCPVCKSQEFSPKWKGFITVIDADRSEAAKRMGVTMPGKYALKIG
ncbi:MAG: transcription elongation factor subunit Spt4 [archaeon]